MSGEVVVSYGTTASTTRVLREGPHRFRWHRVPGESAVKAAGAVPGGLRDLFARAGTRGVRFAVPEPAPEGGYAQVLPDSVSVGWHLLAGSALPRQYTDVVRRVGEAVRGLHAVAEGVHGTVRGLHAGADGVHGTVPWLDGLARWLAERPDPVAARLVRRIGGERSTRLAQWAAHLSVPGGVLLGTLSPGVIVVDRRDRTAHVLVSAEAGYGPPALDLGTLAEALSTSVAVASRGAHRAPDNLGYGVLWDAFTAGYGAAGGYGSAGYGSAGYGDGVPRADVKRAAVLRRVHRLRSISGHLGDNAVFDEQLAALPDLVDGDTIVPLDRRN
ncbi:hypothetical protein DF268_28105 [Streptomyces sp. V2]|uniref:Aminoglycoside phosphotransferase domain-containing protein n=1 Tax=Streptomyces niveiscabiei TaxID=164115 RepID=A0ABW9HWA3_9ACTN|nr:hypothetical protein [Streptomyces sp. V2]PWG10311.1 hypothetical protein DF268_28105 [Streptomyces sp. V2]